MRRLNMSPPAGQDVNDASSFQHPELYVPGQLNLYFSKKAFFKCALHGGYSSLVLFFIPYAALYDTMRDDGKDIADYQSFALLTQTCLLFTVSIQVCWLFPPFGSFLFTERKEQLHFSTRFLTVCSWGWRCPTGRRWTLCLCWEVWPCTLWSRSPCTVMACSSCYRGRSPL